MYQRILTFSLIFLAAVAEMSLFPILFFGGVAPDVVLILVIIWSSRKSFESFWIWAIIAGFILDAVSLERIGTSAISFLLISFGINFLSKRFFLGQRRRAFFWVMMLVLVGTVVHYFLGMTIEVATQSLSLSAFSFKILLFKLLNNAIMLALIYWPVISCKNIFPVAETNLVK